MDKNTYEVYQAIAHLIVNREYKPAEFQLFGVASDYLGAKMKEYESGLEKAEVSDDSGADVPDSAKEA